MEAIQKKVTRIMNILMGVTMSFCLSLFGTATSGHFTVVSWLISFVVSTLIALIIGFLINQKKLSDSINDKLGIKNKWGRLALGSLVSNIIYTPLLTIIMVALAMFGANAGINKAVAAKDNEISAAQQEITQAQDEIDTLNEQLANTPDDPALTGQLDGANQKLAGLNEKLKGLEAAKSEIEAGRPPVAIVMISSLIKCFILAYVIIFIVQPLYLKLSFKIVGVEMP